MFRDQSVGFEATWCGVERDGRGNEEREIGDDARCEQLHRRLKRIVKARGSLDAQEAAALREADRLRVWRHYGYASLIEYMEMEMGYTPRAAVERLRVAKAIVELPAIADAMAQGDLSFSAGRELTRIATPQTEAEWLEAAADKNMRDVEDMVSGRKPGDKPTDPVDPALRTRPQRFDDIDDETRALLRQARQILERERGERVSDRDLLRTFARMVIDGAASPERTRAPYQIAVTVCEQCKRGWQDGGGITVEMSAPSLEVALCDAQHIGSTEPDEARGAQHIGSTEPDEARGAQHIGSIEADEARGGPQPIEAVGIQRQAQRAKSTIPPTVRRKVRARDHGRCRVPWCRSSRNIDQHHLVPRSEGGEHTLDNLITLCESHHLAHHAGSLLIEGTATSPSFTRRAHHSFSIAARAVDTSRALLGLGFDKREVKVAMEKTRAHVGTAELTIEQWIKIALGYCPKPR
jgi:hypothetical protein